MFVITAPVCRQGLESISNLILNKNRYSVIPAYAGIRLINNIQRNVIPAKAGIHYKTCILFNINIMFIS